MFLNLYSLFDLVVMNCNIAFYSKLLVLIMYEMGNLSTFKSNHLSLIFSH